MPSIVLNGSSAMCLKTRDTGEGEYLGTFNTVIVKIMGHQDHSGELNHIIMNWSNITTQHRWYKKKKREFEIRTLQLRLLLKLFTIRA